MRVVQLLPTLSFGDGVGNDAIALKEIIGKMGYSTDIYAENIDKRLPEGTAIKADKLRDLKKDDVLIYHKSTGTDLSFKIDNYKCRRVMIYHNITPPDFFRPYSASATQLTEYGYKGVEYLRDKMDYVLAVSEYNKSELIRMGYTCKIDISPSLTKFEDYEQAPDEATMKKYRDGKKNIIFVGRIAPNKKQENIIRAYCCYRKLNPNSRLILVGSANGMENYNERLVKYVKALGLSDDVIFTGHIKFSEILAYYHIADAFLCMSEHEGLCVPLVESMFFGVPIIAYNTSAIGETLGGSGILLDDNDPVFTAAVMDRLLTDDKLRESVIEGQRKRLEYFSYERLSNIFETKLKAFIDGKTAT